MLLHLGPDILLPIFQLLNPCEASKCLQTCTYLHNFVVNNKKRLRLPRLKVVYSKSLLVVTESSSDCCKRITEPISLEEFCDQYSNRALERLTIDQELLNQEFCEEIVQNFQKAIVESTTLELTKCDMNNADIDSVCEMFAEFGKDAVSVRDSDAVGAHLYRILERSTSSKLTHIFVRNSKFSLTYQQAQHCMVDARDLELCWTNPECPTYTSLYFTTLLTWLQCAPIIQMQQDIDRLILQVDHQFKWSIKCPHPLLPNRFYVIKMESESNNVSAAPEVTER